MVSLIPTVAARESLATARKKRHYVIRTIFVTLLVLLAFIMVSFNVQRGATGFGLGVFLVISLLQLVLTILITVAGTSASMTEEKEIGTFDVLRLTDLSVLEIVIGKWFSRFFQAALIMSASLPIMIWLIAYGALTPRLVMIAYMAILCSNALIGAVGLLCSILARSTTTAILLASAFLMLIYATGFIPVSLGATGGGLNIMGVPQAVWDWISATNPFLVIMSAVPGRNLNVPHVPFVIIHVIATIAVLLISIILLPYVYRREGRAVCKSSAVGIDSFDGDQEESTDINTIRRRLGKPHWRWLVTWLPLSLGNPLAVREALRVHPAVIIALGVFLGIFVFLGSYFNIRMLVPVVMIGIWLMIYLEVILRAARTFALERQQRTLEVLLSTGLSDREIVLGKMLGTFAPYGTIITMLVFFETMVFILSPGSPGHIAGGIAIFFNNCFHHGVDFCAIVSVGMFISLRSVRMVNAVAATLVCSLVGLVMITPTTLLLYVPMMTGNMKADQLSSILIIGAIPLLVKLILTVIFYHQSVRILRATPVPNDL
jgi:ABC-type Na+ efflux pump permease subunit